MIILALTIHWAIGAPQGSPAEEEVTEKPIVTILKHINQLNDDGSYTFGFEASDGSFRVETRDPKGNVKGKYGYVDEDGQVKTVEYVAGNGNGFSAQGDHIPIPAVPVPPSSGNDDDEFGTDEDWQSVDADEDGIPDPPRPKELRGTPIVPRPVVAVAPPVVRVAAAPQFVPQAPAPVAPQAGQAPLIPGLPAGFPAHLVPKVGPGQRLIAIPFGGPVPPGFKLLQPQQPPQARQAPSQ